MANPKVFIEFDSNDAEIKNRLQGLFDTVTTGSQKMSGAFANSFKSSVGESDKFLKTFQSQFGTFLQQQTALLDRFEKAQTASKRTGADQRDKIRLTEAEVAERAAKAEAEATRRYSELETSYRKKGLDATRQAIFELEAQKRVLADAALRDTEKQVQQEIAARQKGINAQLQQLRSIEKSQTGGRTFTEQLENAGFFSKLPGGNTLSSLMSTITSLKGGFKALRESSDEGERSTAKFTLGAVGLTAAVAGVAAAVYGTVKAFNFLEEHGRAWDDAMDGLSISLSRAKLSTAELEEEQKRLIHNAPIIGREFGMSSREILKLQSNIVGYSGITGKTLDQLTQLSVGVANATGKSAEQIAIMIAKAADPEYAAELSKLGIVFKENMTIGERMAYVQEKFGASIQASKDAAKDAYGEYDNLKNTFSDLVDKISDRAFQELGPLFGVAENGATSLADTIGNELVAAVKDFVTAFIEIHDAFNSIEDWANKAESDVKRWVANSVNSVNKFGVELAKTIGLMSPNAVADRMTVDDSYTDSKGVIHVPASEDTGGWEGGSGDVRKTGGAQSLVEGGTSNALDKRPESKKKEKTAEQLRQEAFDRARAQEDQFYAEQLSRIQSARNRNEITEAQADSQRREQERKHYQTLLQYAQLYQQQKHEYITALVKMDADDIKRGHASEITELHQHQQLLLDAISDAATKGEITKTQSAQQEYDVRRQFLEGEIEYERKAGNDTVQLQENLRQLTRQRNAAILAEQEDARKKAEEEAKKKRELSEKEEDLRVSLIDDSQARQLAQEELRYQRERWKYQGHKDMLLLIEQDHWRKLAQIGLGGSTQLISVTTSMLSSGLQGAFSVVDGKINDFIDKGFNAKESVIGGFFAGMAKSAVSSLQNAGINFITTSLSTAMLGDTLKKKIQEIAAAAALDNPNVRLAIALSGGMSGGGLMGLITALSGGLSDSLGDAPAQTFAGGGVNIDGPGTGTSDSILARISKGESVLTAERTQQYLPTILSIHAGTFPRFAAGGVGIGQETLRVVGPTQSFDGGNIAPDSPEQIAINNKYGIRNKAKETQSKDAIADWLAKRYNFDAEIANQVTAGMKTGYKPEDVAQYMGELAAFESVMRSTGYLNYGGFSNKNLNTKWKNEILKAGTDAVRDLLYSQKEKEINDKLDERASLGFALKNGLLQPAYNAGTGVATGIANPIAGIVDKIGGTNLKGGISSLQQSGSNAMGFEPTGVSILGMPAESINEALISMAIPAPKVGLGNATKFLNAKNASLLERAAGSENMFAKMFSNSKVQSGLKYGINNLDETAGYFSSALEGDTAGLATNFVGGKKFDQMLGKGTSQIGDTLQKALPNLSEKFTNPIKKLEDKIIGALEEKADRLGVGAEIKDLASGQIGKLKGKATGSIKGSVKGSIKEGISNLAELSPEEEKQQTQDHNKSIIEIEEAHTEEVLKVTQDREQEKKKIHDKAAKEQTSETKAAMGMIGNITGQGLGTVTNMWKGAFAQQNEVVQTVGGQIIDTMSGYVEQQIQNYLLDLTTKETVEGTKQALDVESATVKVTSDRMKDTSTIASTAVTQASVGPTVAAEESKQGSNLLTAVSDAIKWLMTTFGPLGLALGAGVAIAGIYGIYQGAKALFKFGEGGVVDRPEEFLFGSGGQYRGLRGEAGKEAIIPLDKMPDLMTSMGYIPKQVANRSISNSIAQTPFSGSSSAIATELQRLGDRVVQAYASAPAPAILDQNKNILSMEQTQVIRKSRRIGG